MKIAVVGATGLVGKVMLEILGNRDFPTDELIPVASDKSVGTTVKFKSTDIPVVNLKTAVDQHPEIALFSAGATVSKEWAPKFAETGTFVVDNSSAWRMDEGIRLIVPEINAHLLREEDRIIANPNCSTIQMVVALYPLHKRYGINRLVISTYQSFTGTGIKAVNQYHAERNGDQQLFEKAYPHPIFENCLPHCDVFFENGYTKEEMKLVDETRKIFDDYEIKITATAVRVPVNGGHSESVNVEFKEAYTESEVLALLHTAEGVVVLNDPMNNIYPMPISAKDRDEVFVGRIRRDNSIENGLNLWIVSDNLRKGAATNAVQIAEYLVRKGLVKSKATVV